MIRISLCLCALFAAISQAAEPEIDFDRDILPVLSDACFRCHGPDEKARQAGLRLDARDAALAAADSGETAIVPGKPDESELVRRVLSDDPDVKMPPPGSNLELRPEQKELLKRWIAEGAAYQPHWAFVPIRRPLLPAVPQKISDDQERPRNAIDHFIFARLAAEKLAPSPVADRARLIRRASLDLIGLPPSPEEAEAFVSDNAPDAYDRLIDRLLASPRLGERMAWDWLDAARYADSNGYQGDGERTMWPWRDWVVEAFNRNLPYDKFTVWQLAGDLLPDASLEQKLATGFCRNHMINGEGGRIPDENRVDYVMDMAETTGTVWMGLTFNCCRCHDHKFDPLLKREYYSLFAFFNQTPVDGGGGNPQTPPVIEMPTDEQKARLAQAQEAARQAASELDAFETAFFTRDEGKSLDQSEKAASLSEDLKKILRTGAAQRNSAQLSQLEKQWEKETPEYVEKLKAARASTDRRNSASQSIPRVMVMQDMPAPRKTFMLEKGLYNKPGDEVSAGVPGVLPPLAPEASKNRLGLANWLVSPEHPLTARVTVNRLWQQFFGVGLVKTPEDFGAQGEKPSHPELLDWLSAELIDSGWDVKHLCRLIVTSATYRQSSRVSPALVERDPENRLLARGPRHRLPSWMLRDQALAASGLMVHSLGGESVKPYQPPGVWEEITFGKKTYGQDHGEKLYRRSLYTFWRRIVGPTMFFDTASRQTCSVRQVRTNSPLHALSTLNDVTYVEAARALAERALHEPGPGSEHRIDRIFRLTLARAPSESEQQVLTATAARLTEQFAANRAEAEKLLRVGESPRDERLDVVEHAAWTALCLAVLNLDETLTKE